MKDVFPVAVIGFFTVLTAIRHIQSPSPFLMLCLIAQCTGLRGLFTDNKTSINISHYAFTSAVWVGAVFGVELKMVVLASAFAVASRRLVGGCMFRIAAGKSKGGDPLYDLLYAVPCLVALLRISLQGNDGGSVDPYQADARLYDPQDPTSDHRRSNVCHTAPDLG